MSEAEKYKGNRPLAILILLALLLLVIGALTIPVWLVNRHYADQLSEIEHRVQVLRRVIENSRHLEPEYKQLLAVQGSDKRYLHSKSDALAAAELQRIVKSAVVPNGGEILSTQIVSKGQDKTSQQVSLKVRMKADLTALVKVFHRLETGYPLVFIDSVKIRSRSVNARRVIRRNSSALMAARILDVDFQLSGYLRSKENES